MMKTSVVAMLSDSHELVSFLIKLKFSFNYTKISTKLFKYANYFSIFIRKNFMFYIADLHTHSHYAAATSPALCLETLYQWAIIKGIDVVGTGDLHIRVG